VSGRWTGPPCDSGPDQLTPRRPVLPPPRTLARSIRHTFQTPLCLALLFHCAQHLPCAAGPEITTTTLLSSSLCSPERRRAGTRRERVADCSPCLSPLANHISTRAPADAAMDNRARHANPPRPANGTGLRPSVPASRVPCRYYSTRKGYVRPSSSTPIHHPINDLHGSVLFL